MAAGGEGELDPQEHGRGDLGRPAGEVYDWYVRGVQLLDTGNAGAAAELLTHAHELEPESLSVREALARALFDSRRYVEAASHFERLVGRNPDDDYARFEPQRLAHKAALQALTDAETGVRGYRLTQDPAFLSPYRDAEERFTDAMASAIDVSRDEEVRRRLHVERAAGDRWLSTYAVPLASTPVDELDAREPAFAQIGKVGFDEYRSAHADTTERLDLVQAQRLERGKTLQTVALLVALVAVVLGFLVVVVTAVRTHHALVRPLRRLRTVISSFGDGVPGARADESDGPVELREIARALNAAASQSEQVSAEREDLLRMRELAREIGRRVGRTLHTEDVVREAVSAVGTAIDADRVYVRLVADDVLGDQVTEWYAEGLGPCGEGWTGVGVPATQWVRRLLMEGRTWHAADVRDPSDAPDGLTGNHVRRTGARSTVVVPIGSGEQLLGMLVIIQVRRRRCWDPALLQLAQAVAADLGRALVHAASYRRQEELVVRLRELDGVKTDFLSTVSHELRTPLTSIAGYVELVRDEDAGPVTPAMDRMLQVVDRNAARLKALIEDLLTLSRIEADSFRVEAGPVELLALVQGVADRMRPAAAAAGVDLVLDAGTGPLQLTGDARQLERALLNLVSNAVKFTPDGGRVIVSVVAEEDRALVEVRDTGIGIPAAEQERLFTRFFRASNATAAAIQGTGLGLTIVRGILEHHGGSLEIESTEGVGTKAVMCLVLDGEEDSDTGKDEASHAAGGIAVGVGAL